MPKLVIILTEDHDTSVKIADCVKQHFPLYPSDLVHCVEAHVPSSKIAAMNIIGALWPSHRLPTNQCNPGVGGYDP